MLDMETIILYGAILVVGVYAGWIDITWASSSV
jgi:hypothetical protein